MNWDHSLETGVMKIDSQHKSLFDRMCQIQEAGKNGTSANELLNTLLFLKRYVSEHLRDEEELQVKSKYPKYEEHKRAHQVFMKKLDEIFDKCHNDGVDLMTILETNMMVYDWFVIHIKQVDMEFADYYRQWK